MEVLKKSLQHKHSLLKLIYLACAVTIGKTLGLSLEILTDNFDTFGWISFLLIVEWPWSHQVNVFNRVVQCWDIKHLIAHAPPLSPRDSVNYPALEARGSSPQVRLFDDVDRYIYRICQCYSPIEWCSSKSAYTYLCCTDAPLQGTSSYGPNINQVQLLRRVLKW